METATAIEDCREYQNRQNEKRRQETSRRRDARERVRKAISEQQRFDEGRQAVRGVLGVRWSAVLDAEAALAQGEIGAHDGLVGSLIDLASAAALGAEELAVDRSAFEQAGEPERSTRVL